MFSQGVCTSAWLALRNRYIASSAVPAHLRGDALRLQQILLNLLGNAIKFTAQGQVTFRVRHAREMATIEIEDTGPGLSAQEIAQIFEPFARGTASTQAAPGAGLGLTIAKMLTDLMGGSVQLLIDPDRNLGEGDPIPERFRGANR